MGLCKLNYEEENLGIEIAVNPHQISTPVRLELKKKKKKNTEQTLYIEVKFCIFLSIGKILRNYILREILAPL